MSCARRAIFILGLAGAACSLTNLDGFARGDADGAPMDAATLTDDGPVAPPSPEAGQDAPTSDGDAATPRACATAHTFCDDFDSSELFGLAWTRTQEGSVRGAIDLVTNRTLTAPRSARMTLAADRAKTALGWSPNNLKAVSIHAGLDVSFEQLPASTQVLGLAFSTDPAIWSLTLYFARGNATVFEAEYRKLADGGEAFVQNSYEAPFIPPVNGWIHVELDYGDGSTFSLRVTPRGETTTTLFDRRPLATPPLVGAPTAEVGLGDNVGNGVAYYDEVFFDAK